MVSKSFLTRSCCQYVPLFPSDADPVDQETGINQRHPGLCTMGHSISKPEWHAPQSHHQVVVEPTSRPRKEGTRRWFGSGRNDHANVSIKVPLLGPLPESVYSLIVLYNQNLYETHNVAPQQTSRTRQQRLLFNRTPNTSKQLPRVPVAQVIVQRPAERYRTRDYRTRLQNSFDRRSPSPIPITVPVVKHPPTIGGRAFHPPKTLALMDVGSRLAEKGKDAKRGFKDSLRAERERRFNDSKLSETPHIPSPGMLIADMYRSL